MTSPWKQVNWYMKLHILYNYYEPTEARWWPCISELCQYWFMFGIKQVMFDIKQVTILNLDARINLIDVQTLRPYIPIKTYYSTFKIPYNTTTTAYVAKFLGRIGSHIRLWDLEYMKSLGACYSIKMPRCGCLEHGLEYITFNVQNYKAHLAALFWFPAGSRRAARGARICKDLLFDRNNRLQKCNSQ